MCKKKNQENNKDLLCEGIERKTKLHKSQNQDAGSLPSQTAINVDYSGPRKCNTIRNRDKNSKNEEDEAKMRKSPWGGCHILNLGEIFLTLLSWKNG